MKKTINFILPGLGDSGGMFVVKKYSEMLKNAGWDVVIYCPIEAYNVHRYKSRLKNLIHQWYCTLKTISEINSKKYCKWIWKVSNKTIRDADYSIATLWASVYDVVKLDCSKGEKIYFIQDYEIWDNPELAKKTYLLPLKKIVISTWINDCLKHDLGIGPFPIVYNGMDSDWFHSNFNRKLMEKPTFLMLNHRLSKKGIKFGLKAFEIIKRKYPSASMRMFGMCDNSNLPTYVEYHCNPSKSKLMELYSTSDIFIFPSLEEGWGLTPLEAMACGCIVIGTKTGFVLDLGQHEENMMISQPGNVDEMVYNIEKILKDQYLGEKIRENAYKTVSKLKWENSRDILISLLGNK